MQTIITKEAFEKARKYSAKVNKTDVKRTIFEISVKVPEGTSQEVFDAVVNYLMDQGFKNMGYRPASPKDLTWDIIEGAALAEPSERKAGFPTTITGAIKDSVNQFSLYEANGSLDQLFAAKGNGRTKEQFIFDGVLHSTNKALGDRKNKDKEVLKDKYQAEIKARIAQALEGGLKPTGLEEEDF